MVFKIWQPYQNNMHGTLSPLKSIRTKFGRGWYTLCTYQFPLEVMLLDLVEASQKKGRVHESESERKDFEGKGGLSFQH